MGHKTRAVQTKNTWSKTLKSTQISADWVCIWATTLWDVYHFCFKLPRARKWKKILKLKTKGTKSILLLYLIFSLGCFKEQAKYFRKQMLFLFWPSCSMYVWHLHLKWRALFYCCFMHINAMHNGTIRRFDRNFNLH